MGAAWCKDRAAQAQDSKSPLDRVIVKCVNQMSLGERPAVHGNVVQGPVKYPRLHIGSVSNRGKEGPPEPIRTNAPSEWHDVVLKVPDLPEERTRVAPVPPPRKKRVKQEKREQQPVAKDEPKVEEVVVKEVPKKKQSIPETPVIYLEVDTPLAKHRVKSNPVLYQEPELELMAVKAESETDLLRLPRRSKSSMSLRSASPVSEATTERLDNYLKSCRSFGSLKPEELIDELSQALSDTSSEDSWGGLDDWDLGINEHFDTTGGSPLTPTSQLASQNSPTRGHNRAEFVLGEPKKERKKSKESMKRRLKKHKSDSKTTDKTESRQESKIAGMDSREEILTVLTPPANFQTDPKSHIHKGGNSLIKPSQISVQDFLRQSNDKNKSSKLHEDGKLMAGLPELTLDVPTENSSFSFDFSKGLMPPRSPQIEIPGTPNTPRGLSRCSSPLPAMFMNDIDNARTPTSSPTHDEEETNANLMRILQEYHCTADMIGDRDAKKILEELGIPEDLLAEVPEIHKPQENNEGEKENVFKVVEGVDGCMQKMGVPDENGSSGMSSMTPSLTELEASLSELLEASAVNNDDDEFEEELQNQTPQAVSTPRKIEEDRVTKMTKKSRKEERTKKGQAPPAPPHKETPQEVVISAAPTAPPHKEAPQEVVISQAPFTPPHKETPLELVISQAPTAPPHKETPLELVISQEAPKILSTKHEEITPSVHKSKTDDAVSKTTEEEPKHPNLITLSNGV